MKLVITAGAAAKDYWRDVWQYRELLYLLAWRDVLVRYKQTVVGAAWVTLRPALTMLVFVGFRRMVGLPSGAVPDPLLVLTAVLPWQFFSSALTEASASLISNANLVSKVYFPRLIVPAAVVLTNLLDLMVTLILLAIVMAWYGFVPGWQVVAVPLFLALAVALVMGAGLLLASLNVEYRDFRHVVPFIVQFGLFVTPIAFTTANVPPRWRPFYSLNPMVGITDGFRWSLLGGRVGLDLGPLCASIAVTALCLVVGVWYFRRMERGFADVI
jgi:lipopolysaccharide transport system permease protein